MDIKFHRILSELWPIGYNGGHVIWRPCGVDGSNPTVDRHFGNVHLFRGPGSLTDSVQMKSRILFIRDNRIAMGTNCAPLIADLFL